MQFPKQPKRKKKALNNKRLERGFICEICSNNEATETHEIFSGSNRQNSIKYNMQLKLCHECHDNWHRHYTKDQKDIYKASFQQLFNKKYPELSFYDIFGKNYL